MAAFDFNALLSELGKWRRPAGAMPTMGMGAGNFGGGKGPTNMQMPQMQPPQLLGPGNPMNAPMSFNPIASPLAPSAAAPQAPKSKMEQAIAAGYVDSRGVPHSPEDPNLLQYF